MNTLADFNPGDRVELNPATDRWMMGDRYGEVIAVGRKYVQVLMDRSGHTVKLRPGLVHRT